MEDDTSVDTGPGAMTERQQIKLVMRQSAVVAVPDDAGSGTATPRAQAAPEEYATESDGASTAACDDVLTSSFAATISSIDDDAAIATFAWLLDKPPRAGF